MLSASQVIKDLKALGSPTRAAGAARYFKTAKGEYGYGDIFWGVSVPEQRKLAIRYAALPLAEVQKLLEHKVHECRLTALFILVRQYAKADEKTRENIAKFYVRNVRYINNWDLVDSSAPQILGNHLLDKPRAILYRMAESKNIWHRRIAILSTFTFIRENDFTDTLELSRLLLHDTHDLMHKAAGWALREVGKKSPATEKAFLHKYATTMPRTMLRYAIEKFPESERKDFLGMKTKGESSKS